MMEATETYPFSERLPSKLLGRSSRRGCTSPPPWRGVGDRSDGLDLIGGSKIPHELGILPQ